VWQNRPLDAVHPVLSIDAIVVKARDAQVANRPVYVAIGVDLQAERDVPGLWLGPSGGEGAKAWATMLTELRNRGLADALIVCCDGLRGLPESIRAAWPDATVQTCVVHLIRRSLAHASYKERRPLAAALKTIYRAPTEASAAAALDALEAGPWGEKYPATLWRYYTQLTEIEQAFKELKHDLAIRPVFHQRGERIEAHIFVAFVAYCLHVTLKNLARPRAPGLTPRAVLEKFSTMQMVDVHLPTTDGRHIVLPRRTDPTRDQQLLLHQLDLRLPEQPPPRISV